MNKTIFGLGLVTLTEISHAALTVVESNTNVGPGNTISVINTLNFLDVFGDGSLIVLDQDVFSVEPDTPSTSSLPGALAGVGTVFFRANEAPGVPDPAGSGTSSSPSTAFIESVGQNFYIFDRLDSGNTGFRNGAQLGNDNWMYFSRNNAGATPDTSSWVQVDITESSVTPVRYVYDPANPFADFTLVEALAAVDAIPEPGTGLLFLLSGLTFLRRKR